ncbi:winged helix-turn-helix domain-containing protein [Yersinia ruckeri]|uniref:winged helix-turn-helix domain-containing protein n=1 Tax=Yersinia ruckeri TaxID=29486 RepID=UPI0022377A06|nr:winged helix-turn-helix domain-containing protein [Yersinia ruckeri]EKN4700029.1 winged helix-turn-helix domain-containing protein [Yersinia ruckeri]ELM3740991.1 winged helix-turn-helix domain-containing protein [Yersinia ruckeri]ELM3747755.1 winged helix-turn-helix domain-containing protein [Yersinia ruckeri]MCW6634463.1 winged helix-turn-helix domain-containing protein [Yersinia ruckeri]MCW6638797.1 winged helix-turn-helix domain-containing protein [Yersinia ruckeri]
MPNLDGANDCTTTIYVNKEHRRIQIGAALFQLSEAEITLLMLLLDAKGKPISKHNLLSQGWSGRIVSPTSLPVSIKHIRDIFKSVGHTEVLCTVKNGGGYFILDGIFNLELIVPSSIDVLDETLVQIVNTDCEVNAKSSSDWISIVSIVITLSLLVLFIIYNASFVYEKNNVISNSPIGDTLTTELESLSIKYKNDHLFISGDGTYLVCNSKNCEFAM